MKNENRMSEGQHKFLRKVRDGVWQLPELLKWAKISDANFSRWLENKYFRRNYDRYLSIWVCRSRSELQMAAVVARQLLARGAWQDGTKLSDEDRLQLNELIDAANRERREMLAERRLWRKSKKTALDPERPLLHPSFQGREGEFLAAMKKAGMKDEG